LAADEHDDENEDDEDDDDDDASKRQHRPCFTGISSSVRTRVSVTLLLHHARAKKARHEVPNGTLGDGVFLKNDFLENV